MLKCRDVPQQTTSLLAGQLDWRQRLALRLHLLICGHCRRYVRQLRRLLAGLPLMHGEASDAEVDAVVRRVCDHADTH